MCPPKHVWLAIILSCIKPCDEDTCWHKHSPGSLVELISHQMSAGCATTHARCIRRPGSVRAQWSRQWFLLYTNDCHSKHDLCSFVTAVIDLSTCETACQEVVSDFAWWWRDHFLVLIAQKTKELIIDFRRDPTPLKDLAISGETDKYVSETYYSMQIQHW